MHIDGRVVVDQVDGPGVSVFVGWHPSQLSLTCDDDDDVAKT